MSFKKVKEFVDAMKELEFPETLQLDSFQYPDFRLMGSILLWLCQRCDPSFQLPFEIDTEQDRVFFLRAITDHLKRRFSITLDPRKLYMADGHAVREMLKISRIITNYSSTWNDSQRLEPSLMDEDLKEKLMAKVMDLKSFRREQGNIAATSAEIFNMLKHEPEHQRIRINALNSKVDPAKVERTITSSIRDLEESTKEYQQKLENVDMDRGSLEAKIKKREEEVERMERRFQTMQAAKPTHSDGTEKLENEIKELHSVYCTKYMALVGSEFEVAKMEKTIEKARKGTNGSSGFEVERVNNRRVVGVGIETNGGVDDGFNEEPVDHSESEPEVPRTRSLSNIGRQNGTVGSSHSGDEEPSNGRPASNLSNAQLSDDEF